MKNIRLGYAMCGSFCTLSRSVEELEKIVNAGYEVYPIMSEIAFSTDTKFGKCSDINKRIEGICKKPIIHTVVDAEPFGPNDLIDILVIAPCTGNTASKLSLGITDTAVTMAAKAQLRKNLPVLLAISTNDALGATAKNIGTIYNTKNVYTVPMKQDNPKFKPNSMVSDFSLLIPCIEAAIERKQYQPMF